MTVEHVDLLVVGAGVSGIGAGYYLQKKCPDRSFAILEGRQQIGGTGDLFRYPGIRSDSDMHTLGYSFRPWRGDKSIADGPSILNYLKETAAAFGIERKIRFGHRVQSASWSSADNKRTLQLRREGQAESVAMICNFLFMCSGYFRFDQGYNPQFEGIEQFAGPVIHPQHWPDDLDYAGKRLVVIGSGASAVTLVPALAEHAAHVTMLQRSPTYVVSLPSVNPLGAWCKRWLPIGLAYGLTRWKNLLYGMYIFKMCRSRLALVKRRILDEVRKALVPDYHVEKHFTPRYNPWDQRLCLVPDGDLFKAIRKGSVSVVTDRIAGCDVGGLKLAAGEALPADLIVTVTGLHMQLLAGIPVRVDGEPVQLHKTFTYKGMMYAGVPNLASSFGYINASWTLRSDLTCNYVCRLLNHMKKTGKLRWTPCLSDPDMQEADWINFSLDYIRRALAHSPRQGTSRPWTQNQNYLKDLLEIRFGRVDDPEMEFAA